MIVPARMLLRSASWLYGAAVAVRNGLYNRKILRSHSFSLPVICVGNITAGGTGKTPHVIYLAGKLAPEAAVAVLSRGYRRKSRGFRKVTADSTTAEAGDEPLLMAQSLPEAELFVDRDRVNGIREIERSSPGTGVVILDDGFQHRALRAGMNIILTEWGRLMSRDRLLPYGLLREPVRAAERADMIVVTKTPAATGQEERERVVEELRSAGITKPLFFTTLAYESPRQLYSGSPREITPGTSLLLVTGIANPEPMREWLTQKGAMVTHMAFPDHHSYTRADITAITAAWEKSGGKEKMIMTTAKDAVRLKEIVIIADHLKEALYYLPVRVQFMEGEEQFLNKVYSYVGKDYQNG